MSGLSFSSPESGDATRIISLALALVCVAPVPSSAQEAKVQEFISKKLIDLPGKEGLMIMVEYAPGGHDPVHRHNPTGLSTCSKGRL